MVVGLIAHDGWWATEAEAVNGWAVAPRLSGREDIVSLLEPPQSVKAKTEHSS